MHVEFAQSSLSESGVGLGSCSCLQWLISSLPCMQWWSLYFCIRSLGAGTETLDSQNAVMDQTASFATQYQV